MHTTLRKQNKIMLKYENHSTEHGERVVTPVILNRATEKEKRIHNNNNTGKVSCQFIKLLRSVHLDFI